LGAGPASQNLIVAKAHAAFNGKFSPDIEDVKAVATEFYGTELLKIIKRMPKELLRK
jgi:MoxR-like ATPase